MNMTEKEDVTNFTATMTTAIFAPTTITAEKEDSTDSTAIVTTATATSVVCASEWDDGITEVLQESTAVNDQIYVFGKRQWLKPDRKWRTPTYIPGLQ